MEFVDHNYLGMRPWTRENAIELLDDVEDRIENSNPNSVTDQAKEIQNALKHELQLDMSNPCAGQTNRIRLESVYSVVRGMTGTTLRDSFHLGSSIINDYGGHARMR
jgi:hypothetical protein